MHTCILNGRLFNDKDGSSTCIANNGKSVVEYILASTDLFECFTNLGVCDQYFTD